MKIEIRPEIGISMFMCSSEKMEAISCLVPELRSETHRRRGMQVFKKTQCFYAVTVKKIIVMSPYTIVLRKIDSYSCKKAARKSAKTVGKDSGG